MESRNCIERKELYRRISFLVVMLFSFTLLFAKGGTQQGIAYLYDYKTKTKAPIANVQLTVAGASPTTSRADGTFTLVFSTYGMGDRIAFSKQPYYKGLKVFNKKVVDNWSIKKDRIVLIMCKYEEFELAKSNYYQLGMKAATEKYEHQIRQIKANHKLKEAEMRQQLQEAEENYLRAMELMSESSEEMARIDQSELDDEMRAILDLYERGEVEEAMTKLNALNLKEKFERVLDIKHENEKKVEQNKQDSITILNSIRSSIELYKNNNDFEKVGEYLKLLADRLRTAYDHFVYASFCKTQNLFLEANRYYDMALAQYRCMAAENPSEYEPYLAGILYNIAEMYCQIQRFDESKKMYKEALEIYHHLVDENPSYETGIAAALNGLGQLYVSTQRYTNAEEMYVKALELYRHYADKDSLEFDPYVAKSLVNLASLNKMIGQFDKSEAMYTEALEIYKRLSVSYPSFFDSSIGFILNSLATLYSETDRFIEAEKLFGEALEITRRLVAVNERAFNPELSRVLNNFALLYTSNHLLSNLDFSTESSRKNLQEYVIWLERREQRYSNAEKMFKEAIEINRSLATQNPTAFEPVMAPVLNNLAMLYYETGRNAEAEETYKEALNIIRHLVSLYPSVYEQRLSNTLYNLATFYSDTKKYADAERLYNEALAISRTLIASNPYAFEPYYTRSLVGLAGLYSQVKRKKDAEKLYNEALEFLHGIEENNPQLYQEKIRNIESSIKFLDDKYFDKIINEMKP